MSDPTKPIPAKASPPNQGSVVGKPVVKAVVTPDLRDRIIVVRRDVRKGGYKLPKQGKPFKGVDEFKTADGYVFATVQISDPPGVWVDEYYIKSRHDQERYNWTVAYPYVDKHYPQLTRTYVCMRSDYMVIKEPDADTTDPTSKDLYLVEHKIERIENDPVLDAMFVKVIRVFERLPSPTIRSYDMNQFQQVVAADVWEVVSGPPPLLAATVEKAMQERTGTAKAKNTLATVPRVFPDEVQKTEIPSMTRELWLGGFFEYNDTQTSAGQATQPQISPGVYSVTDEQTTEFKHRKINQTLPLPQDRHHKELTSEFGGGVLGEDMFVDTPSSPLDIDQGFLTTESKLRNLKEFGKIKMTKSLISIEKSSIDVLTPGFGYTSAPTISVSPAAGAVASAQMGRTVDHVNVTSPGSNQYDFPPAVQFNGPCMEPAQGIAFISKGLSSILVTAVGSGYRSAPAVQIVGGGGTGATATAFLGKKLDFIRVTARGAGYKKPIVVITGGNGTRATAIVKPKNLTHSGGILKITLVNEGRHYDTAPTITIFDAANNGTGATAVAVMKPEGQVKRIDVTNPGKDYTTLPIVIISGGGGQNAAGLAILSKKGRLDRIVMTYGGVGYLNAPLIALSGGAFSTPIGQGSAVAVLSTTYHVAKITLQTPGNYTPGAPEPKVVFSGGGGQGAQAQYIIGGWPVLYGSTVNTKYGLITQITKRIVPAGTQWRPGLGFTEVHPHDKWRSIMITSRIDPRSIPQPVVYPTVRELHLPSTLLNVIPNIASTNEDSVTGRLALGGVANQGNTDQKVSETLTATADISGSFETHLQHGYQGPAAALIQELFFLGPPNPQVLPIPLKITPVYGTVVMKTTNHRASITTGRLAYGHGNRTSTRIETRTIGPVLSGPFHFQASGSLTAQATGWTPTPVPIVFQPPLNGVPGDPSLLATLSPTGGIHSLSIEDRTLYISPAQIEAIASWSLSVGLPLSSPLSLDSGTVFLENMQTERLGLNVWMVRLIYVIVP